MEARIIQIGNSLGVRLPKNVLATLQLDRASTVMVLTRGDSIVLKPVKKPRNGWAAAFAASSGAAPQNPWGDIPADEAWGT